MNCPMMTSVFVSRALAPWRRLGIVNCRCAGAEPEKNTHKRGVKDSDGRHSGVRDFIWKTKKK